MNELFTSGKLSTLILDERIKQGFFTNSISKLKSIISKIFN